jgi:hypothetical protein
MRITLSWHNSEVSEVAWLPRAAGAVETEGAEGSEGDGSDAAGDMRVVWAVASVQRAGLSTTTAAGSNAGGEWGFIKGAVLTLSGAQLMGDAALASPLSDCIGSMAQGQWLEDAPGAQRGLSEVARPRRTQASGTLSLAFRNGSTLKVHAQCAWIELPPEAMFIESYAC